MTFYNSSTPSQLSSTCYYSSAMLMKGKGKRNRERNNLSVSISVFDSEIIVEFVAKVTVAGYTAGQRAKQIPRGKYVAGASILTGTSITMLLLVLMRVFPFTPRYIIPISGMMVGNSMTVTGVTMKRLRDDIQVQMNLVSSKPLTLYTKIQLQSLTETVFYFILFYFCPSLLFRLRRLWLLVLPHDKLRISK